ncbi:MAG: hypothetical protein JW797_13165 [Bradymonadales bacterium]|nr:hypothetical protein [Bradymonadales bacterium]
MTVNANFFRVELWLKQGLEHLQNSSGLPDREHWLSVLKEAQDILLRSRTDTDRAYATWRQHYYEVNRASKALWTCCRQVGEACQQWGIEGLPDVAVPYLEPDRMHQRAAEVLQFLEPLDRPLPWLDKARSDLKEALSRAAAAVQHEADTLAEYRQKVRARKVGFEHARDTYLAFYEENKGALPHQGKAMTRLNPYFY